MSDDTSVRLTREALYDLIWSKPMTSVAASFGMSSVAFAKHVTRLDIPRPGRGYWQQLATGQKPKRVALGKPKPGTPLEVTITKHNPRVELPRDRAPVPDVKVSETLAAPHPIILKIQKQLTPLYRGHGMKAIRGDGPAVIRVSSETEPRAMRVLDSLLKALRERGHEVQLRCLSSEPEKFALEAVVRGENPVKFWLVEHLDRSEHVLTDQERKQKARSGYSWAPNHDFAPSGRLILEIHRPWDAEVRCRWADGKKQRLEDALGEMVVGLEVAAMAWRENRDRRDCERRIAEECQQRKEAEQRENAYRHALGEDLVKMAAAWRQAETVAAFLAAVEARVPTEDRSVGLSAWLTWAKEHALSIDPLSNPGSIAKNLKPAG